MTPTEKTGETSRRRVLAFGPAQGLVTGQSQAFLTYVHGSRHAIFVVNTNDEGTSLATHVLSTLRVVSCATYRLLFLTPECLYISTSRSKLGAIKDLTVIFVARAMRVPVVNHLHGLSFVNFRESLGSLYGAIVDWSYRYITASIVLHERLTTQYARYPRMKIHVVNNFVDAAVAGSFRRKDFSAGSINILFLSNIVPEKGVFELIDAVKNALVVDPRGFHCKIAGRFLPGEGMSSVQVEAKFQRSIAAIPEIEYCGFADQAKKKALLEWAHVLALPSYMKEEAVPLALLEGMSAGCFLIVADFGIMPDLVQGLIATVVPPRDVESLEHALMHLARNRRLLDDALSVNPRVAENQYSEGRYILGIDEVIEACVAGRAS